jgi:hypothetical protein
MEVNSIHYLEGTYHGGGVFSPVICKLQMRETLFPHQIALQDFSENGERS